MLIFYINPMEAIVGMHKYVIFVELALQANEGK